MNKKPSLLFRLILAAAGAVALLLIAALSVYSIWERPPEHAEAPLEARALTPDAPPPAETETPSPEPTEEPGVYTLLLVGNDDGNGNTDTILLGRIDTGARRMDFVSIPRDTLINADWEVRKINAVYWGDRLYGGDGIGALRRHVQKLSGVWADSYAVLDLSDLIHAVDLMGGLRFDVPIAMHYDDPTQDLHIHLEPGEQLLDGEQVMGLCRYRSSYPSGDLGRIEMQQRFLRACLEQFTQLGRIPNLTKVADYLAGELDTDLSAANIAWYLRQALSIGGEGLSFSTLPTVPATVHGYSYAVVDLDAWLPLLNERLNPGEREITAEDLDLVFRSGGVFASTTTLLGSGYYSWTPPAAAAPAPAPEPVPAPLPAETAEPGPRIITVVPGGADGPEETDSPALIVPEETEEPPAPVPEDEGLIAAVILEHE